MINIEYLAWIISMPTYRKIKKWERIKRASTFKKIALILKKEFGNTDEIKEILDAIRPIK